MPSRLSRLSILLLAVAMAGSTVAALASPGVPASTLPLESTVTVADAPLVADAGNSAYVASGEHVVLHGTQFGGQPPYTYEWTVEAGDLLSPDNPTAVIATDGLASGSHTATLTVTDGAGDSASATVRYTVAGDEPGEERPLDSWNVSFDTPGVADQGTAPTQFSFEVPEGLASVTVTLTWTVPTNDYDLRVLDPDGNERGSSTDFIPDNSETVTITDPQAGDGWIAQVERFATVGDPEITVTVVGTEPGPVSVPDTRPTVDAGGPYAFLVGATQSLSAEVAGASQVAWDLDLDGVFDVAGTDVVAALPPGRHLVQVEAISPEGDRTRQMTSVRVARDQDELDAMAVPFTVIGVADSGINPYHLEFSAAAYPDPEVLELTRDFTRHPSEYLDGFPEDAKTLPITLGRGYFPDQDIPIWQAGNFVEPGTIYWIPGTKIIGAIDAGGFSDSVHPILDDNGHGTGSASVAAGNRYGYCPTCLLVVADSLSGGTARINQLDFVDISTNSWGYVGGLPIGLATGPNQGAKAAAERGQTILFSAGNGVGNTFFDVPILTYGSDWSGPDWVITVGAIREDNNGAIIADGVPAHVSNLGDGDLPSACRTGDTGQCAFGGTSAASPYTAGVFGTVLTEIRRSLGDHGRIGQREGQVIAQGTPVEGSGFLADGRLTRQELRAAVLKASEPRYEAEQQGRFYPLPQHWNLDQAHYVFEGYGSPGPAAAERAIEVLLGLRDMPSRAEEDEFFLRDCQARDAIYGSYDRNGDGTPDSCAEASEAVAFTGEGDRSNDDPRDGHFDAARDAVPQGGVATDPITYFLHRRPVHAPTDAGQPPADLPPNDGGPCAESFNESYLDRVNTDDDVELCFTDRVTSFIAAYRPKGIFAAKDVLTQALPAGSQVTATVFMRSSEPTLTELSLVLKATDRAIGRSAAVVQPTNPLGWTEFTLELETERHVAAGEQLSLHFVHLGPRGWAYGYNGEHASSVTITPAPMPDGGLEFGVTVDAPAADEALDAGTITLAGQVAVPQLGSDPQLAGFHPVSTAVQVAVDDADFHRPVYADVDPVTGTWTADLELADGEYTVSVRALRDRFASDVTTVTLVVGDVTEEPPPGGGDDEDERPGRRGPPFDPPRGKPSELPGPPPGRGGPNHTLASVASEGGVLALGLAALLGAGVATSRLRRRGTDA